MEPSAHITAPTLADVWEESVRLLLRVPPDSLVDSTTGGPAVEIENLLLTVTQPLANPQVSPHYALPDLIDDYAGLFTATAAKRPYDAETIADRIYGWKTENGPLNQLHAVIEELRLRPRSRRAVISLWDPSSDLAAGAATPLGHCLAWLSLREESLNMSLVSRSVDAWLGAVPNMIAFTGLMKQAASDLKVEVGSYSHFIFSYHIYQRDLPAARNALEK